MKFYHGSFERHAPGTILVPQASEPDDYAVILEAHRPASYLSRAHAVFMVDNPDDIDAAGGYTEWCHEVSPLEPVTKHDLNWATAISVLLSQHTTGDELAAAARAYWAGIPHPTDCPVWEYLTAKARVLRVERYETFEVTG